MTGIAAAIAAGGLRVEWSHVVAQSRFLAGIPAAAVRAILAKATPRRFPARTIVTHQGATATELFLITKGRVRYFSSTPDGQKILLHWLGQGEILAAPRCWRNGRHIISTRKR